MVLARLESYVAHRSQEAERDLAERQHRIAHPSASYPGTIPPSSPSPPGSHPQQRSTPSSGPQSTYKVAIGGHCLRPYEHP